ncbi:MAG: protein kinase, partial [Treponema sp.]|nr:protein kinase [Treponema sp.]
MDDLSETGSDENQAAHIEQIKKLDRLPELTPGDMLRGRYKVIKTIAAGGQGWVYLAYDTDLDPEKKKPLVIKQLLKPSDGARERFKREANTLIDLGDSGAENIVRIRTYDEEEREDREKKKTTFQFIVMEYVDGTTLEKLITEQGGIPVPLALYIFGQVCKGLEAAHEKGIIHRDIKPENVLISRNGDVKLTDFGLAGTEKVIEEENLSSIGTLRFMSPEQIRDSSSVDDRTDIYSMGCMLYRMLFNAYPFDDSDKDKLKAKILEGKYILPLERDLAFPRELNDIIVSMMETNRRKRPGIIGDVIKNLSSGLDPRELRTQLKSMMSGKSDGLKNPALNLELLIPEEWGTLLDSGRMEPVASILNHSYGTIYFRKKKNADGSWSFIGSKSLAPGSYELKIEFGPYVHWKCFSLSYGRDKKLVLDTDYFKWKKTPLTIHAHAFDAESGAELPQTKFFAVDQHSSSNWVKLDSISGLLERDGKVQIKVLCDGYNQKEVDYTSSIEMLDWYQDSISVEIPLTKTGMSNAFDVERGILKKYTGYASAVTVPEDVSEIGDRAFQNCTTVSSVAIPSSIKKIGDRAFQGCCISELSHPCLMIHDGLAIKDGMLLYYAKRASDVTIPDGVTEIGSNAFSGCTSLEHV